MNATNAPVKKDTDAIHVLYVLVHISLMWYVIYTSPATVAR